MAAAEKKKKDIIDDEEENEDGEGQEAVEKGSKLKIIIIIAIAVVLLGGGGAAAYFFFFKAKTQVPAEKKSTAQIKPQEIVFWPLDPFIVNLADNDGERYLKVVMQLELSDKKMTEEMKILNPKLRDTILDLLSSKSYKEMIDPVAKQRLRDEIAMKMNMNLKMGKVLKVYFTEFIIQ